MMTTRNGAFLYQINVSNGGVPKRPIEQACISLKGIDGDIQKNRAVHGGVNRALCLYSFERIEALRQEGHPIEPGSSGENLTVVGLDWSYIKPGDRIRIGETLRVEVTSYADPCRHNARWFTNNDYMRISQKRHPGWSRVYAKVLAEGTVQPGDVIFIDEKDMSEKPA